LDELMMKKTPVYEYHTQHGNIVQYAGYELPVWFEGIIPECKTVRNHVGLFDVSHMGRIKVTGVQSENFLNRLVTSNVSNLHVGQGQYSILCNESGGIIDDITIFRLKPSEFLIVYNAANREKNWNWLLKHVDSKHGDDVKLHDLSDDSAMYAVQGPQAGNVLKKISGLHLEDVDKYSSTTGSVNGIDVLVTRSGYTGEDGFEIYVWKTSVEKPQGAMSVWNKILIEGREYGIRPVGLGARDVLRLEAGMCLYGNDIDEKTTPVEARLNFVVRLDKKEKFPGEDVIMKQRENGPPVVRIGFKMIGRGIPRHDQTFTSNGLQIGRVTSGTFSPTLNLGIGMGYVKPGLSKPGEKLEVRIRDRDVPAEVVKLPFYQRKSHEKLLVFGTEIDVKEFRTQSVVVKNPA
jgi:aminomethyltransferase